MIDMNFQSRESVEGQHCQQAEIANKPAHCCAMESETLPATARPWASDDALCSSGGLAVEPSSCKAYAWPVSPCSSASSQSNVEDAMEQLVMQKCRKEPRKTAPIKRRKLQSSLITAGEHEWVEFMSRANAGRQEYNNFVGSQNCHLQ